MEERILRKLYLRNAAAGGFGLVLCGAMFAFTRDPRNFIFIPFILLGVIYSTWNLKHNVSDGNVIAVYAECFSVEQNSKLNKKKMYRFVTAVEGADHDDAEQDAMSFYVLAGTGAFFPGQQYCMLFKKMSDNALSEKNLIGYEKTYQEAMSFALNGEEQEKDGVCEHRS